ncbi:MAG: elongation factor P maturation arginine rhamnosyltransferase EarP [Chitinispirillales bacterium]|nr:elongation factor P maturation arginine rhamnosyltransferase EarP [Chitinispirillales bacterium]
MEYSSIDIFCRYIDNFGDAGVAYRLAKEFKAARPDCRVRLFMSYMYALNAIESGIDPTKEIQEHGSIVYVQMSNTLDPAESGLGVADVLVEIFACDIPQKMFAAALDNSKLIINLEYLSAEEWVEEYHLFESLLGRGTARKFFFMQGFRETTGGLIINSKLRALREGGGLDRLAVINGVAGRFGAPIEPGGAPLVGTVFTYRRGFDTLIADLVGFGRDTLLLVFGVMSQHGMAATLGRLSGTGQHTEQRPPNYEYRYNGEFTGQCHTYKNVRVLYAPFIPQHDYDTLLCCADFNLVRGEDSLARAVLSGRPFIWQAYIQADEHQCVKVEALLKTMRPYYVESGFDGAFAEYCALEMAFNRADRKSTEQVTEERYGAFFKDLKKHERVARAINYFMHKSCDLIAKFRDFLDRYPESAPPTDKRANMRDPLQLREYATIINTKK